MPIEIVPIPALRDNYIWALVDQKKGHCAVIDPGDATPVLNFLKKQDLQLSAILITHHHWDHTRGIHEIVQHHPIPVFGPAVENIPHRTHPVAGGQTIDLPHLALTLHVIDTPAHTLGHVCYYGNQSLFCGDTLFTGGCGRTFEGTPAQLYHTLQRLAALSEETQIYCGHEYTQKNLEFALSVDPNNVILKERLDDCMQKRAKGLPTVPSTMTLEKQTNPFLRCHVPDIQRAAETQARKPLPEAERVFEVLRAMKDTF